ncbi:unnamed protein product [Adineta steineri]|uniref:Uncharacterized protein n=1 Tax=Adineta steineri TaxID=433720 RepID=A0A813UG55_9BILA|nr:unnamed protein product [Adineta steineri]CAF0827217.1 unnamed protein product [Adineta steineri]
MNQLITYNNPNDGVTSRRYTAFPLNSTLISTYTSDTIRSIINHATTGKPYTTAVWIRISRVGIQIKAQDPQIARTRIPVFIPIAHVHDIFMQPNINNVICIVYEEVKSNMKGVLLYVVHPSDAHLIRDDFRHVKQSSYSKGNENQIIVDTKSPDNKQLISPSSQKSNDIFRAGKANRQQSPRRILYVRDGDINTTREKTPLSAPPLPQLSYTPFNNSYHSSRDDSGGYRRHKSPRKVKTGNSSSKTASDSGSKHRHKHRSRSPQKPSKPQESSDNTSQKITIAQSPTPVQQQQPQQPQQQQQQQQQTLLQQQQQQQLQQQQLLFQQQQIAAWQAAQQAPVVPMGIYNRYVPKVIPLPTGEKIKTTLSPSNTNGMVVAHIETQQTATSDGYDKSSTRSRSISPKRSDHQYRSRPLSAENADASAILIQSSHHRHHHHRRHQVNGHSHSASKPESKIYNTISHPSRTRLKYGPPPTNNNNNNNNNTDTDNETKQYLKRLIDDMQAMKLEMNKMRLASSSVGGTTRGRSDSLRLNLKELRTDIDAIRQRMAMTPRVAKQ